MVLNPVRDDRTVSVDEKYIKPNTIIELTNVSVSYMRTRLLNSVNAQPGVDGCSRSDSTEDSSRCPNQWVS